MDQKQIQYTWWWKVFWKRWYGFVDNFFWYAWRPFWGFVLELPNFLEEEVVVRLVNKLRKKRNPNAQEWCPEFFSRCFTWLMFQCPNCRSTCLNELWVKRSERHRVRTPTPA